MLFCCINYIVYNAKLLKSVKTVGIGWKKLRKAYQTDIDRRAFDSAYLHVTLISPVNTAIC